MSKNLFMGAILMAVLVGCVAGWLLLPSLQSPERSVERATSVQLERARRLLHDYDAGLAYKSLLTRRLDEEGIEVDPDDLSDDAADEYQRIHQTLWETYQPKDWRRTPPRPVRASYGNLSGQIREGLREHAASVAENRRLLDEALTAVGEALSFTEDGASSRSHAEATRLKGVILYQMGLAERVRAQLHRREGDDYRRKLTALAAGAAQASLARSPVAGGTGEDDIARLKAEAAELKAAIDEDRRKLSSLDATIGDLETRLAQAESRRGEAEHAIAVLKAEGVDFSDADGAERFAIRLDALSRAYREADREAHAIAYGTYRNARIDDSGDYLHGRYLDEESAADPLIEFGLARFRNERTVLEARIEGKQRELADLRDDIARLEEMERAYQDAREQAAQRIEQAAAAATEAYTELNRLDAEAFAIEDRALEFLDRSARTSQQASRSAEQWVTNARERTRDLSPVAAERSAFNARLRDGWIGGYVAVQEADARLAKAWIHYDRYRSYRQTAAVLAQAVKELPLGEADPDTEAAKARNAHDAGVEEIKKAMAILQRAHGKVQRHWTLAAQAAGATYLMVLFGHEDYVTDAVEGYRNAVKGRQDKKFAETFVARLRRLEQR